MDLHRGCGDADERIACEMPTCCSVDSKKWFICSRPGRRPKSTRARCLCVPLAGALLLPLCASLCGQNLLLLCTSSISPAPAVHPSSFWCISLKSILLAELPEVPVGTGIFLSGVTMDSGGSGSLRLPSPALSGGIPVLPG